MTSCTVVVLVSGSGSNLQALIDATSAGAPYCIAAVISNTSEAYGLERAQQAGIATRVLDHRDYPNREDYDRALIDIIDGFAPDLLALAGFMRILTDGFVRHYQGRLLNIHPSLLPKYKGLHTHQRALDAGEQVHGCSVHFVSEELDGGPVIAQARVEVAPADNANTLAARVLQREHFIYPLCVKWFAEGRLALAEGQVLLENAPLAAPVSFAFDSARPLTN